MRGNLLCVLIAPTGFLTKHHWSVKGAGSINAVPGVVSNYATSGRLDFQASLATGTLVEADFISFEVSWYTVQTWPTVLPGTAA